MLLTLVQRTGPILVDLASQVSHIGAGDDYAMKLWSQDVEVDPVVGDDAVKLFALGHLEKNGKKMIKNGKKIIKQNLVTSCIPLVNLDLATSWSAECLGGKNCQANYR